MFNVYSKFDKSNLFLWTIVLYFILCVLILEKAKDRDEIVHLLVQNGSKIKTLSTNGDKAIDILLEKILEDTMPGWSPDYDMQLFNFLIRAGSDLCPFVLPERQEESFTQRMYVDMILCFIFLASFV